MPNIGPMEIAIVLIIALIVFGVLLRTHVLSGEDSVELTIVPAGVAGLLLVVGVLVALIPPDLAKRIEPFAEAHGGERAGAIAANVAKAPAIVGEGFRFAIGLFTHPRQGGLAVIGSRTRCASPVRPASSRRPPRSTRWT